MQSLDFEEEAYRSFAFLLANGFHLRARQLTRVIFACSLYEVEIFYDERSLGIDVGIRSIENPTFGTFSFDVLISALNGKGVDVITPSSNITTDDKMKLRLAFLADQFRKSVDFESFRTSTLFQRMKMRSEEMWRDRYPTITADQLASRLVSMWEQGEYRGLVRLFAPLREHLSEHEKHILENAERILRQSSQHAVGDAQESKLN